MQLINIHPMISSRSNTQMVETEKQQITQATQYRLTNLLVSYYRHETIYT